MSRVERIAEWQVFPEGCDPDEIDASLFAITVRWRGTYNGKSGGGWSVVNNSAELSRGGSWEWSVPRFRRWQHRWESLDEAQEVARRHVDSVRINGRTWADWQARRSS